MKPKYYLNKDNGLVYRDNGDGTESYLYTDMTGWSKPCNLFITQRPCEFFKEYMRPISPYAVRHFEQNGYNNANLRGLP